MNDLNNIEKIVVVKEEVFAYPREGSFRPSKLYPEYLWKEEISDKENKVYEMVRNSFYLAEYDKFNYGTKDWNPLNCIVKPGYNVLIKPNMVMDENHIKDNGTDCLFTNPSVVAAVVDYVIIALKGEGTIVIGDAPMQECNFDKLVNESGYRNLLEFYENRLMGTNISIKLVDFRGLKSIRKNGINISEETNVCGTVIDLKNDSAFAGENKQYYDNIRITNYDPAILKKHHNENNHEYMINNYVLQADAVINIPKPKTHRKAGVTISMKNMVGMNCRKEYLPHHTNGAKEEGGDEYKNKSIYKKLLDKICDRKNYLQQTKKAYKRVWLINKLFRLVLILSDIFDKDKIYEGSWSGNDTVCRMVVDLNRILFYADKEGKMNPNVQRKELIVADMIVSGEKEGPVEPSPKKVGIIAVGENPVCFDETILTLMGAKIDCIPTVKYARKKNKYQLINEMTSTLIISNNEKWNLKTIDKLNKADLLFYEPSSGWKDAFYC